MNKMLVAVFETENQAFEGLTALQDLHKNGDITLYAIAVISKDIKGEVYIKTDADQRSRGLANGVATGISAGLVFSKDAYDIDTTFIEEVFNALIKGKTAVIAEIDEAWTVPVDTRLEAMDAVIIRRIKYEVADQLAREAETIAADYNNLKAEFKQAKEDEKAAIKSTLEEMQNRAQALNVQLNQKLCESKNLFDAKVDAMLVQVKDARDSGKSKVENRINEVKEAYTRRTEKFEQASKWIGTAFANKEEAQKLAA